ncbi:isocitrate lyase/PEP mutase family protein [Jannaschia rubra]|uniref:Carboxyvinyl-carboxyphosphonate phosphorylmutase n=1 Tax=Jannaschia rubra TaxID=282197 RepID=A0A0M6XPH3_9RHOB|nr:isocitrate lyase/phosphoenolpyruvate mutase family protein [Jannaschia rubra]CTQ32999.1 Carboxyvinyl-carboxyphosphonate phosphorylmutase [Jannaschia rubra]SFG59097.1 2-Methylisocitrate lyase, PEP mutase family [Jannaschia rubra]
MTDFRALHRPGDPFILANAWDVGSARMLVALGAQAIGTSSAGYAFTRGLPDGGRIGREEQIAHAADLADHVSVPVSADLEDGFGPEPADCAATVELAAMAGLAGCCIEDVAPDGTPYSFEASVARMDAAAKAARRARHDFVFCARTDGVMHGTYDLEEAIRRLRAFEEVGVDVLYCPMPGSMDDLKRITAATSAPVNALVAGPWTRNGLAEFAEAGVARVSLGSSLARATQKLIRDAGQEMFDAGDFGRLGGIGGREVDALLKQGSD